MSRIKDPRTIEPWIAALNAEYPDVRETAAGALREIQAPRVIEPLIAALEDENLDVRRTAAEALEYRSDSRVVASLISAFKANRLEIIAGASPFFVRRGEAGTETVLIKALNEHGDSDAAFIFLNSDNSRLEAAAIEWARERDYTIPTTLLDKSPRWGAR